LLLSGTTSGCDPYGPGYYGGPNGPGGFVSGEGRLALAWTLNNVPLTEAIEYLAQLSGAKATYDKHAVILSEATVAGTEVKEVAK